MPKKTKEIMKDLYPKLSKEEENQQVLTGIWKIVSYDAENCPCLKNFECVKSNSNCIFAKKARLWGSPAWDQNRTLGMNKFMANNKEMKMNKL